MRISVCALVAAIGLAASPALAQGSPSAATFWKTVQATCDATAARPAGALGKRIAQSAIDEFDRFGGHRIDADGRLFHFGLTEAEHKAEEGSGDDQTTDGQLGWWRVMNYWRALYGDDIGDKLEVRGYRDASSSADAGKRSELLAPDVGDLLKAADGVADPILRETLRDAALRAAAIDTPWSAAFISYVVKQAGVEAKGFQFANAHRAYIYDAFATSAAEVRHETDERIYRACPLSSTRPRMGDMICHQREPTLADAGEQAVRERIRGELAGPPEARSVRRTHCEVVAYVDARARKLYSIGGNVLHSVTTRKLNLRRGLKVSAEQKGKCGGPGHWTMPDAAGHAPGADKDCSLNDRKWFVLLQLR